MKVNDAPSELELYSVPLLAQRSTTLLSPFPSASAYPHLQRTDAIRTFRILRPVFPEAKRSGSAPPAGVPGLEMLTDDLLTVYRKQAPSSSYAAWTNEFTTISRIASFGISGISSLCKPAIRDLKVIWFRIQEYASLMHSRILPRNVRIQPSEVSESVGKDSSLIVRGYRKISVNLKS